MLTSQESMITHVKRKYFLTPMLTAWSAKIKQHLENNCEHTVISCKYEAIGCDVKMKRKYMGAHEQDDKAHLHQALTTVVKLQDYITGFFCLFIVVFWSSFLLYNENTSMKKENKAVQDRLQSATETIASMKEENKGVQDRLQSVATVTSMQKKLVVFKIINYEEKRINNEEFSS